jgi:uncharacterized repeat protein (TIGR03803 family)
VSRIHADVVLGRSKRRFAPLAVAAALFCIGAPGVALADPSTVVYSFAGDGTGAQPYGTMVQAGDGYLYGTATTNSPDNGWGLVFRVKPDGTGYQVVHSFDGSTDGGTPRADLFIGKDGAIYGSSSTGSGNAQYGTLWRVTTAGQFSLLRTFTNADGSYPGTPFVQDGNGVLYGTVASGGGGGRGVVFSMQPDGSQYLVLHQFSGDASGGIPRGIALGSDGVLYGVTAAGGNTGEGVAFAVGTDGNGFKVLHSFDSSVGDGNNPQANIVQLPSDGYLYGTTNGGGSGGYGTVFRFNAAGAFNTVLNFDSISNGAYPTAPLTVGKNGLLYGTAPFGGANDAGTLYEIKPDGTVVGVISTGDSAYIPQAGLTKASNGMLYTPTYAGGSFSSGAILQADPAAFPPPVATLPTETIYFDQLFPPMTTSTVTVGKTIKLHWVSQYAKACVASDSWTGKLRPEGNRYIKHDTVGDYVYTLTCYNKNGSTSTSSTLHVVPK